MPRQGHFLIYGRVQSMQSRFWIFTINNPDSLLDFEGNDSVRYCIYQEEVGDEGTLHLQGYIEFRRSQRMASVKRNLESVSAHVEPRKGSQLEAIAYCSKSDTRVGGPYTFGEPSGGQGVRSDLVAMQKRIDEGVPVRAIASEFFGNYLRYNRGIEKYYNLMAPEQSRERLRVVLYYGPTGTGKSYSASIHSDSTYWRSDSTDKFWANYEGQSTVVFDDFTGWEPYHLMLRYLDVYPVRVGDKGTSRPLCASTIIITSNRLPDQWYAFDRKGFDLRALVRRISQFVWFWDDELLGRPLKFDKYSAFKECILKDSE